MSTGYQNATLSDTTMTEVFIANTNRTGYRIQNSASSISAIEVYAGPEGSEELIADLAAGQFIEERPGESVEERRRLSVKRVSGINSAKYIASESWRL